MNGWMERERDLPRCWVCCVWKFCLVIIIVIIVEGRGICDVFHVLLFGVESRYRYLWWSSSRSANEVRDRICTKVLCILHNHQAQHSCT